MSITGKFWELLRRVMLKFMSIIASPLPLWLHAYTHQTCMGKSLAHILEALPQAFEKGLSTSINTKQMFQAHNKALDTV